MKTGECAEEIIKTCFKYRSKTESVTGSMELMSKGTSSAENTIKDYINMGSGMRFAVFGDTMGPGAQALILAKYTHDGDEFDIACEWIGRNCASHLGIPVWCAVDGVFYWVHGKSRQVGSEVRNTVWWANHLGVHKSTVARWWTKKYVTPQNPKKYRKRVSVDDLCTVGWLRAMEMAESNLIERGWL